LLLVGWPTTANDVGHKTNIGVMKDQHRRIIGVSSAKHAPLSLYLPFALAKKIIWNITKYS
jgi:hypothetical protein